MVAQLPMTKLILFSWILKMKIIREILVAAALLFCGPGQAVPSKLNERTKIPHDASVDQVFEVLKKSRVNNVTQAIGVFDSKFFSQEILLFFLTQTLRNQRRENFPE